MFDAGDVRRTARCPSHWLVSYWNDLQLALLYQLIYLPRQASHYTGFAITSNYSKCRSVLIVDVWSIVPTYVNNQNVIRYANIACWIVSNRKRSLILCSAGRVTNVLSAFSPSPRSELHIFLHHINNEVPILVHWLCNCCSRLISNRCHYFTAARRKCTCR